MNSMSNKNEELLLLLQQGLPLVESPFQDIADIVGLSESEVLQRINKWFTDGTARRLGAIFDSRKMGFTSLLCSAQIPPEELDSITNKMNEDKAITHGYLRGWSDSLPQNLAGAPRGVQFPNYWFTYMGEEQTFESSINKLSEMIFPVKIEQLPAIKRFKIDVIFDSRKDKGALFDSKKHEVKDNTVTTPQFSSIERQIISLIQGNIDIMPQPFTAIAKKVGVSTGELLSILQNWKRVGIIRRISIILRHHSLGFTANGMCLWNVNDDEIEEIGQKLASCREITHCYQRSSFDGFDYNLYAMIHGTSWKETYKLFENIQNEVGLSNGKLLCSLKEYKKSSPIYIS